ncbi:MAG: dTDP-4-dehydrorhamnose reductase [Pseudomonadota bacterium]
MTILVTGAAGQLGRECVERGTEVIGVDRQALDLRDARAIEETLQRLCPKAVINAAAYAAVDRAEQDPDAAFAINRDAVLGLGTACARLQIPLIHISTDYVFDGKKSAPYSEDDPVHPLGVYARSKQEGEQELRRVQKRHLILRTSWVFGRYGANFVKTMLRLAREKPDLRVVADQQGAPTHAGALAEVLLALAHRAAAGEDLPWGTYHYNGQPYTNWHEFAQIIVERAVALGLLAKPVPVRALASADYPTPAQRPENSRLDCARIHARLGVELRDWRLGLDEVLLQLKSSPA